MKHIMWSVALVAGLAGGSAGAQAPAAGTAAAPASASATASPAAPAAAAAASIKPEDVMATLEKLAELKGKGILTQEEFDSKKAELLKKLV